MARTRDDDDDDDRPRRRRRDDDDDDIDVRKKELTGMDGMFGNTNIVALILFGFCCGGIAFVLGVVGLAMCTDAKAKRNALIVTIISAVMTVVGIGLQVVSQLK